MGCAVDDLHAERAARIVRGLAVPDPARQVRVLGPGRKRPAGEVQHNQTFALLDQLGEVLLGVGLMVQGLGIVELQQDDIVVGDQRRSEKLGVLDDRSVDSRVLLQGRLDDRRRLLPIVPRIDVGDDQHAGLGRRGRFFGRGRDRTGGQGDCNQCRVHDIGRLTCRPPLPSLAPSRDDRHSPPAPWGPSKDRRTVRV